MISITQGKRRVSVGSGQTSTSTSPADVTGCTLPIAAGESVSFVGEVLFEVSSASGGLGLGVNGSAAATYVAGRVDGVQSAGNFVAQVTAYASTTNAGSVPSLGVVYYARISGRIVNGGSDSNLSLQFARGGSGTLTIRSATLEILP